VGGLDMPSKRRLPLKRAQTKKKTMQCWLVDQARRNKSGCITQNRLKRLAQSQKDRAMHRTPETPSHTAPRIGVAQALKVRVKVLESGGFHIA